jgi:hypothetical protein
VFWLATVFVQALRVLENFDRIGESDAMLFLVL